MTTATIGRWGNANAIRLPKAVCGQVGLSADDVVSGSIVTEQVRAMDLDAREASKLGEIDSETLQKVLTCLKSFY